MEKPCQWEDSAFARRHFVAGVFKECLKERRVYAHLSLREIHDERGVSAISPETEVSPSERPSSTDAVYQASADLLLEGLAEQLANFEGIDDVDCRVSGASACQEGRGTRAHFQFPQD